MPMMTAQPAQGLPFREFDFGELWSSHRRLIFFALFLCAVTLILANRALLAPEEGDHAMWDYTAQAILRGQAPYKDVVNIQAPLTGYMSALAIVAGKAAGLNDLIAIRCLFITLAGTLLLATLAVTESYSGSRIAALLSFFAPLACPRFYSWVSIGTEPKLVMILFGMLSVLLVAKNQPFWAGFLAMLSCLSWQPGLLFAGTAMVAFWPDRRAIAKTAIAAAIPLLVTILYFYSVGALRDLWRWCFLFDLTVYAPHAYRSLTEQARHIANVANHFVGAPGLILLGLGAIGYVTAIAAVLRRRSRAWTLAKPSGRAPAAAILLPPAIYVAYWRFDFNSGPYLIPIFPFAAAFAGSLIASAIRLIGSQRRGGHRKKIIGIELWQVAGLIVGAGFAVVATATSLGTKYQGSTLNDEYAALQTLTTRLSPEDTIYAQGEINILTLLNRPNISKYIWFDRGKDDFAAAEVPGGFEEILDAIKSQKPKFVELGRSGLVRHQRDLQEWLDQDYSPFPMLGFEVYIRLAGEADSEKIENPKVNERSKAPDAN